MFFGWMRTAGRLRRDRRGQLAVIMALLFPAIAGSAGLAIDLAHALAVRTQLEAAAEATALNAVSLASLASVNGLPEPDRRRTLQEQARRVFGEEVGNSGMTDRVSIAVEPLAEENGGRFSMRVAYRAAIPTTFLKALGKDTLRIGGVARAVAGDALFQDIHILVDNSPSMGIAVTPDEAQRLVALAGAQATGANAGNTAGVSPNCAFVCHMPAANGRIDLFALARAGGIRLKIDAAREAALGIVALAQKALVQPEQHRFSLYTFGSDIGRAALQPLEATLRNEARTETVRARLADTGLMMVPDPGFRSGFGATPLTKAIAALARIVPPSGNGQLPGSRRQVVVLVSDGLNARRADAACTGSINDGRCVDPFSPRPCERLKARGVRIATILVEPRNLNAQPVILTRVGTIRATAAGAMRACASPGLFFEADADGSLPPEVSRLFGTDLRMPLVTQ